MHKIYSLMHSNNVSNTYAINRIKKAINECDSNGTSEAVPILLIYNT